MTCEHVKFIRVGIINDARSDDGDKMVAVLKCLKLSD